MTTLLGIGRVTAMSKSIYYPHCHKHTELSVALTPNERVPAYYRDFADRVWWIGVCNSCSEPCLVEEQSGLIYPHPLPAPTDDHVPKNLKTDLDEAKMCFSVGCYRACAVMARRCMQQACITKGATKKNLVEQIAELTHGGHITKEIEEWATVVRWIGNDAAHPGGKSVTKEDAEDTLTLAEQFLHVLFVTTALAKARRAKRGK